MIHIALHFLLPLLVAAFFFRGRLSYAYLTMLCGLVIDLDHLLADPIYDSLRCSIGFHPLHSEYAIAGYGVLLVLSLPFALGERVFGKARYGVNLLAIGLWIHILLDAMDCLV